MSIAIEEFGLGIRSDWITPSARWYRPPCWPPPRDWVVSEDRDGNVLSRWGYPSWDLSPLAGRPFSLNFGDGPCINIAPIDKENANLLRLVVTWRIWGHRPVKTTGTLRLHFQILRPIIALCSREGILASELMRFPMVLEQVPSVVAPSIYDAVMAQLHRLFDARDTLGFVLVDAEGLKRLAAMRPTHEEVQTPYIPPRIWTYQVNRLRECLDDFLAHRQQVEDCYQFCVDAYAHNYGSLQLALTTAVVQHRAPFAAQHNNNPGAVTGYRFYGPFWQTAGRFGIRNLLQRWFDCPDDEPGLKQFTGYLTMVQYAGLAYIANFTLQRIEEAASLRMDCLVFEEDERLGRVPIICGETTKTDPDSDARWPTSPSVQVAVEAMRSVARLRMRCAAADPIVAVTDADQANPYLFARTYEPWAGGKAKGPYSVRRKANAYIEVIRKFPKLFNTEQLRITEDDLKIAGMLTPNLPEDEFAVGMVWPLAWHQSRRTGAVNMFASGMLSDSSIQFLMKQASRLMPLYYGMGYTKLHLNEEVEGLVTATMYEVMAQSILAAMGDRFVSPYSDEKKEVIMVNLIGDKDAKDLSKAARRGEVFFRETRLGACTKRGNCSYGGVESIARCAGGDGYKPCTDVLYDRTRAPAIERDKAKVDQELKQVPEGSPRHQALLVERKGLENFLNVVRN